MSLSDVAAKLGVPVFPVRMSQRDDGTWDKFPAISKADGGNGFHDATTEPTAISRLFSHRNANAIGMPTGTASGICVIDVDTKHGRDGRPWLDENRDALPETRTIRTPSGGLHLWFRMPDGIDIRNSAGKVSVGVDVRGNGGYVVLPPSPGYAIADATEPAEMPRWLIKACTKEEAKQLPPRAPNQDPHEKYVQTALDNEVLAVSRAMEGTRNDRLNEAAFKLGTLVGAGALDRGTVEADLYRAALASGLSGREAAVTIKSGLDAGTAHPREMPERRTAIPDEPPPPEIEDPGYWETAADPHWQSPLPDDDAPIDGEVTRVADPWNALDPVAFPIHAIPPNLRGFVLNRAKVIGCDPAALSWACLSACSAAIDGRIQLQMKRHDDWKVRPALWVALIGLPSTKKSPIMVAAWQPLEKIQGAALRYYQSAMAEWESLPKKEREQVDKPPHPRRLTTHDATMEALQDILSHQDRGIGVLRDELSGWLGAMEKYSAGKGGAADRAFWLQGYNGGGHVVDRVMRGTLSINNLLMTVCGGIQPDRLNKFPDLTDDGLWQRFVPIIVGPATLGTDEPAGAEVDSYAELIQRLLSLPSDGVVTLSHEAHLVRDDVARRIFQLESDGVLGPRFVGFVGKLTGLWGRLTLVLHCIVNPILTIRTPVSKDTAEAARTLLLDHVLPNAARVYMAMGGAGGDMEATQSIAGYILTKEKRRLVASDLTSNVRVCKGKSIEDVRALLSPLIAGGWLTPEREYGPTSWLVSEVVHTQFVDRAEIERRRRASVRALINAKLGE